MHKFCRIETERYVEMGKFYEGRVVSHSTQPLHADHSFMDELANQILRHYLGVPTGGKLRMLRETVLKERNGLSDLRERLFKEDLSPSLEFFTEASETLALWIEQDLDKVICARKAGSPHNSTPAFDLIGVTLGDGKHALRLVQVKATESDLRGQSSLAIRKFRKAAERKLEYAIGFEVTLLQDSKYMPDYVDVNDLRYNIQYRVTG